MMGTFEIYDDVGKNVLQLTRGERNYHLGIFGPPEGPSHGQCECYIYFTPHQMCKIVGYLSAHILNEDIRIQDGRNGEGT